MKKIFMLTAVAIFATVTFVNAQLQRGNVLIGADLANFNLGLKKNSTFEMNLTPKVAWFIRDNLAVGGLVNVDLRTLGEDEGTYLRYGVDALGRYYINDPTVNLLKHGRFFLEGNAGIGGTNYSKGESTNGLDLGFGPGYAYFITPNVGLETLLKYEGNVGFGNATSQSFLTLGFGFQIYLPGRSTANRVISTESK